MSQRCGILSSTPISAAAISTPVSVRFSRSTFEPFFAEEAKDGRREYWREPPKADQSGKVARKSCPSWQGSRQAGEAVGAAGASVQKAKKVATVAPQLKAKVAAGTLSLDQAYTQAKAVERDNRAHEPPPAKPQADKILLLTRRLRRKRTGTSSFRPTGAPQESALPESGKWNASKRARIGRRTPLSRPSRPRR